MIVEAMLSPPAEVLDAIGAAASAYDRLAADDRRLHFHVGSLTGRLTVQVIDASGGVVGTVAPSVALQVAEGADLS